MPISEHARNDANCQTRVILYLARVGRVHFHLMLNFIINPVSAIKRSCNGIICMEIHHLGCLGTLRKKEITIRLSGSLSLEHVRRECKAEPRVICIIIVGPAVPAFTSNTSENAVLGPGNTQCRRLESALPPVVGFREATIKYVCVHHPSLPNDSTVATSSNSQLPHFMAPSLIHQQLQVVDDAAWSWAPPLYDSEL